MPDDGLCRVICRLSDVLVAIAKAQKKVGQDLDHIRFKQTAKGHHEGLKGHQCTLTVLCVFRVLNGRREGGDDVMLFEREDAQPLHHTGKTVGCSLALTELGPLKQLLHELFTQTASIGLDSLDQWGQTLGYSLLHLLGGSFEGSHQFVDGGRNLGICGGQMLCQRTNADDDTLTDVVVHFRGGGRCVHVVLKDVEENRNILLAMVLDHVECSSKHLIAHLCVAVGKPAVDERIHNKHELVAGDVGGNALEGCGNAQALLPRIHKFLHYGPSILVKLLGGQLVQLIVPCQQPLNHNVGLPTVNGKSGRQGPCHSPLDGGQRSLSNGSKQQALLRHKLELLVIPELRSQCRVCVVFIVAGQPTRGQNLGCWLKVELGKRLNNGLSQCRGARQISVQ
eukprot:comp24257_c0_seq1/m.44984 comp24257_c0_seq1/g.44984  ORF comp24257_c0_seq1/g.44984 comp24257_c0_seq1/m.44984 type:complete len:395 (+) comp24257_c0_seq1:4096-5280(+)